MKTLIVIPTYNEKQNLPGLFNQIFSLNIPSVEILIVDDNSPDGTSDWITSLSQENPRLHLLKRPAKLGLGTAYVAGFKYALARDYDVVMEMDADLSHNPKEIPSFLEKISKCDLVIGSRYLTGVNVINWPLSRLILSVGANTYTRIITGLPVRDATGGYKAFRRQVLEAINLDKIHSDGYSFQIETTFKAWRKGFRICEIPIIFTDRTKGESKMSKKIVREAVWMVWKLKLLSITGNL